MTEPSLHRPAARNLHGRCRIDPQEVARLRNLHGLSLVKLADKVQAHGARLTPEHLCRIENGQVETSFVGLRRALEKALDVDMGSLAADDQPTDASIAK